MSDALSLSLISLSSTDSRSKSRTTAQCAGSFREQNERRQHWNCFRTRRCSMCFCSCCASLELSRPVIGLNFGQVERHLRIQSSKCNADFRLAVEAAEKAKVGKATTCSMATTIEIGGYTVSGGGGEESCQRAGICYTMHCKGRYGPSSSSSPSYQNRAEVLPSIHPSLPFRRGQVPEKVQGLRVQRGGQKVLPRAGQQGLQRRQVLLQILPGQATLQRRPCEIGVIRGGLWGIVLCWRDRRLLLLLIVMTSP